MQQQTQMQLLPSPERCLRERANSWDVPSPHRVQTSLLQKSFGSAPKMFNFNKLLRVDSQRSFTDSPQLSVASSMTPNSYSLDTYDNNTASDFNFHSQDDTEQYNASIDELIDEFEHHSRNNSFTFSTHSNHSLASSPVDDMLSMLGCQQVTERWSPECLPLLHEGTKVAFLPQSQSMHSSSQIFQVQHLSASSSPYEQQVRNTPLSRQSNEGAVLTIAPESMSSTSPQKIMLQHFSSLSPPMDSAGLQSPSCKRKLKVTPRLSEKNLVFHDVELTADEQTSRKRLSLEQNPSNAQDSSYSVIDEDLLNEFTLSQDIDISDSFELMRCRSNSSTTVNYNDSADSFCGAVIKATIRPCQHQGCPKTSQGVSSFCTAHGGGYRCSFLGCETAARNKRFCQKHMDRCKESGCKSGSLRAGGYCGKHGDYSNKICPIEGCKKLIQPGPVKACKEHGGGKRCIADGCDKVKRGKSDYCCKHANDYGVKETCLMDGCFNSVRAKGLCYGHLNATINTLSSVSQDSYA